MLRICFGYGLPDVLVRLQPERRTADSKTTARAARSTFQKQQNLHAPDSRNREYTVSQVMGCGQIIHNYNIMDYKLFSLAQNLNFARPFLFCAFLITFVTTCWRYGNY